MRVLQEKSVQRLGGKETIPVDVRVIAATHRDLEAAIRQKQFREDLFYRISVVVLNLPPLRERKEDIPDLVHFFLQKYAAEFGLENPSVHPEAVEFLQTQPWPGNVRELENVTRKMLLLAQGYTISAAHVRAALAKVSLATASAEKTLHGLADELLGAAQRGELADAHARLHETAERVLIGRAIELAEGNQARAARWLGISRLTLREKLIQFGLHPGRETEP
jgi:DNA-binding NtrC family response regulator